MRAADSDYILALHNGARVVNYAVFTLANGTILNLQPSDFRVTGNNYTDKTTDSSAFSVGSFIGKTANICIDNSDGRFDGYDFYMSRFLLRESIAIGNTVKHVAIGDFTVVTDYTPGSVISFSGVDATYKFDKAHNLTGTKTFKQIISLACTACLGSSTFDATGNFSLYNTSVDTSKLDAKLTWRQLVSYVAIACGYNAYIDATGLLKFKWYDTSVWHSDDLDGGTFDTNTTPYSDGDDADGGDFTFSESTDYDGGAFTDTDDYHIIQSYKNFQIGTYDISITGVRVINGETVVESTSSHDYGYSYVIEVKDNPLCEGKENTIASHLASKLLDFTFRIFSCDVSCDPLIEAGDMALVLDTKGVAHRTLINSVEFSTGGRTKIACQAESIIRQQSSYTSEAAKAVVEANRHTADTLSSYDESVQRMNRLSQNSSGMYTARVLQQDGSYIYYESDHQITYWPDGSVKFVQHSFVAKDAGNGYFYSTDSGTSDLGGYIGSIATTWTGGMDRAGNAVLNTISVFKLLAQEALIGTIKDEAEINYWNLDTGELRMTAGAKINLPKTDYSGTANPTLNNSPASGWTGHYDDHIGETYTNTMTKQTFRFVNNNAVKLHFDSQSQTEDVAYDWVYICYSKDGFDYGLKLGGNIGERDIYVPSADFDIQWRTDFSAHDYYGFRIDSMELASGTTAFSVISDYPSGTLVPIYGTDEIIESEHPYTDNIELLYGVHTGLTLGYMWEDITTTLDEYTSDVASEVVDADVNYQKIMYELTGGGENQGIYNHNGKVYINAQYLKAYSINAKDVAFGTMLFDRCSGGILALGGASNADGELIITDTPYNSSSGSISAGSSVTRTFIPDVDGKLWLTISSSAPSETPCGTWQKSGETAKALYNGENYLGIYLAGETYLYTINADYALSYTEVRADALVTAGNFGIKTSEITATGGHIGGFILTQNELYKLGTYVIFGAKNYRIKYKTVDTTRNIKYFYPNKLDVQDSEFGLSVVYTVDTTMAWSGSQVFLFLQKKVGNSYTTVGNEIRLQYTQGTYTASFNYTFSNTDSTKYRIQLYYYDRVDAHNISITFVSNNVRVVSLKDESIWGNHRGSFFGTGTFDSASITNLESEEIRVTDNYNDKEIVITPTEITKYDGSSYYVAQWQSASDERVKEDVESLDVDLSKNLIDATQPKRFKYKNAEGIHYGMIAQETRELLDNLGETEATLERSLGLPDELSGIEDERMIDYMEYTAHIINYVKDLRAEVNQVKAELNELNRVKTELEAELNKLKEGK